MGKAFSARNEEIYRAATEEKKSYTAIAEEWGLTRQAVWTIIKMEEKRLNGQNKQGELIEKIIYPGIQDWILRRNITLRKFCKSVGCDSQSTNGALRRFLFGESGGNISIIKKILQATGMTFEQAFGDAVQEERVPDVPKAKCVDISQLGLDLEIERKKRGLTQTWVARELGISVQAYQRWERGLTRRISAERYEILSKIFSLNKDTVLEPDIGDTAVASVSPNDVKIENAKIEASRTSKSKNREIYKNISDLGIDLLEERIDRGWSQREAAEKLGVSLLSYCKWETGKTLRVNRKSFRAIQRVFLGKK